MTPKDVQFIEECRKNYIKTGNLKYFIAAGSLGAFSTKKRRKL